MLKKIMNKPSWSIIGKLIILQVFFVCYSNSSTLYAQPYNKILKSDCYFRESDSTWLLGNSMIEININPVNGAIKGLLNKASHVQFTGNCIPESFSLVFSTWENHGAAAKDLWGAAYGSLIRSHNQKVTSKKFENTSVGSKLEITYGQIQADNRTLDIIINYTIEIRNGSEETNWRIKIQNNSKGTVREVLFPVISGLKKFETLLLPNQSGTALRNPVEHLSDEIPDLSIEYPARASMQWFEYYSSNAGLYMASYDKNLDYTKLCFGLVHEGKDVAMWIVKYPFCITGDSWVSPDLCLGIHKGDWHWGADKYRTWIESWVPKATVPKRILEMYGGMDEIFIKDVNEKLKFSYDELFKEIQKRQQGESTDLVGWMFNGHDTYYPEYHPIPDLGGEKALIKAIDMVHQSGRYLGAYVNLRLCNNETETYKKFGKKWAVLLKGPDLGVSSLDFGELHEEWNKTWDRDNQSEGWFSVMCPYAKGWQDYIVSETEKIILDYHFDGLFLDQISSYYAELCYNRNHGHSTPATAWGRGYIEMARRIREVTRKANPESYIYVEGMNDAYGQYIDYYLDKNLVWEPMRIHPAMESFVEMWRYTLPSYIIVNDPASYSFPPAKDKVYGNNYNFVMGIRGIGAPEDEKSFQTAGELVTKKAGIEKIKKLWNEAGEFFFYGTFMDDLGLKISDPDIFAKVYFSKNKEPGIALWNTSASLSTFTLSIDLNSLGLSGLKIIKAITVSNKKNLSYKLEEGKIVLQGTLPPHDIEFISLNGQKN